VQPSGGVDDDRVDPGLDALADRLERHAGGVGTLPVGPHSLGAHPLAPGLQLIGSGRPEGVGGSEQHGLPVPDQRPGQLPAGRRLAGAVDAHHEHYRRQAVMRREVQRPVLVAQLAEQLGAEQLAHLGGPAHAEHLHLGA
jgi:hypothetical protein